MTHIYIMPVRLTILAVAAALAIGAHCAQPSTTRNIPISIHLPERQAALTGETPNCGIACLVEYARNVSRMAVGKVNPAAGEPIVSLNVLALQAKAWGLDVVPLKRTARTNMP